MLSALLLQELSNTASIAADVVSMLIKLFACGLLVVVIGALAAIVGVLALVCACGLVNDICECHGELQPCVSVHSIYYEL